MVFIEYLIQFILATLANVVAGIILRNALGGKKPPWNSGKLENVF